ncbi:hypothetical protein KSF_006870 [Reticulibacter mediterranei]|uniref:Uncharacterized protein n=1 Tax=Reticulibacter mediterranei TaxID=2778369 RepID=A0A8J3MX70_9CHLR|nr:hypothetical protein KSF_006870 [Reticulibacter mediterranei]
MKQAHIPSHRSRLDLALANQRDVNQSDEVCASSSHGFVRGNARSIAVLVSLMKLHESKYTKNTTNNNTNEGR